MLLCLMASFLVYSFPFFRLQSVLVFKRSLKTSGSHFRFLEVCCKLERVGAAGSVAPNRAFE